MCGLVIAFSQDIESKGAVIHADAVLVGNHKEDNWDCWNQLYSLQLKIRAWSCFCMH